MNEINKHVNKPQLPDFGIHDIKSRLLLFINLFIQFSPLLFLNLC